MKYLLTLLFSLGVMFADGQPYYQVNHTSGTQTIGGNSVTVTGVNSIGTSSGICSVAPYIIGIFGSTIGAPNHGGYLFSFSVPVNRIRARFVAFHNTESYNVYVNGVKYTVTTGDVSSYSGTCTGPFPLPSVISGTVINPNSGPPLIDCAHQLDILSGVPIDSVRIYRLQATQGGGCIHDFYFAYDTIAVIAQPYTDTLKCQGDSLYLSYSVTSACYPGNVFTAQLSDASGSFASPVNIGTLNASGAGIIPCVIPAGTPGGTGYRIRIVSSSPVRTSLDNGKDILVKPAPVPTTGSNSPICESSNLNLTATAPTGSTYTWAGPFSFSSTQQNPTINNTNANHSGDYIVTATLNGCSAKDTVSVLVKPIPDTPVATNNTPICSSYDINLTAASTTSGVSYNWTGPSFSSSVQNPVLYNSTVSMSGQYIVTATLNGCTSPADTTTVLVKQTPPPPIGSSNSPVCEGGTLNLTATPTTPGFVFYYWTGPGGSGFPQQNPSISPITQSKAGIYTVTAEVDGCMSTELDTVVVVVNTVSTLGFYANPNDTLCENNNKAIFVALPFNGGTSPQYQWFKNGNIINGATNSTYSANGIIDGDSFHCVMIATGVCTDPLTITSPKMGMTVLPVQPGPSVTITANPPGELSPWQLVTFTATPANAGINPKYQWKRNGQDVTGATSDTWSANNLSNNDTVHCEITSDIWCATPSKDVSNKIVVHIKLGVADVEVLENMQLYPNPNDGKFSLLLSSSRRGGNYAIEIINAVGQVVYQNVVTEEETDIQLDVASGVYVLKVKADGEVRVMRIVVNR